MCVPKLDLDVEGMPEVAADEDGWRLLLAADPVHPAGGKDQGLARGEVHLETLSWHLGISSCESIVRLHVWHLLQRICTWDENVWLPLPSLDHCLKATRFATEGPTTKNEQPEGLDSKGRNHVESPAQI